MQDEVIGTANRHFWDLVKHNLTGNGLRDVAEQYPQFQSEAMELLMLHPRDVNMVQRFGDMMIGSRVRYTGSDLQAIERIGCNKVTVEETPIKVFLDGNLFVRSEGNFLLSVPKRDLAFE